MIRNIVLFYRDSKTIEMQQYRAYEGVSTIEEQAP